jgi:hypothetical protein
MSSPATLILGVTLWTLATIPSCQTLTTEPINVPLNPKSVDLAIRQAVCQSFAPINFIYPGDTKPTVAQIREHNAALATFMCEEFHGLQTGISRSIK